MDILYVNNNHNGRRGKNTVSAFRIDGSRLVHMANFATGGRGCGECAVNGARTIAHLLDLDQSGNHFLFVSNQGDCTISAFGVMRDGRLKPISGQPFKAGIDLSSGSLAITPNGAFLYAGGLDGISGFRIEEGLLQPVDVSGPRLISFLQHRVVADLVVSPGGGFLVASILLDQKLRVYRIERTGHLREVSRRSTAPKHPAGLAMKPSRKTGEPATLFVGGDDPGPIAMPNITVLNMDLKSGKLKSLSSFSFEPACAGSSYLKLNRAGTLLLVGHDDIGAVTVLRVKPPPQPLLTVAPGSPFIWRRSSNLLAMEVNGNDQIVFTSNFHTDEGGRHICDESALHIHQHHQLTPAAGSPFSSRNPNVDLRQSGMVFVQR